MACTHKSTNDKIGEYVKSDWQVVLSALYTLLKETKEVYLLLQCFHGEKKSVTFLYRFPFRNISQ